MAISEKKPEIKTVVVEDFFHFILQRTMADINIPGFNKYKELAADIYNATAQIESEVREDLIVVFITHTEETRDAMGLPLTKLKLTGKFTEEVTDLPSYFTYILEAKVLTEEDRPLYKFLTNKRTTSDLAKTPMGCFEEQYIDNDLKTAIEIIEEFEG